MGSNYFALRCISGTFTAKEKHKISQSWRMPDCPVLTGSSCIRLCII